MSYPLSVGNFVQSFHRDNKILSCKLFFSLQDDSSSLFGSIKILTHRSIECIITTQLCAD